jgi:GT2 family glycosyltransferase
MTRAAPDEPKVGIVILSWNDAESLTGCLDSLEKSAWGNLAIVVVDNGSVKYDARELCAGRPRVTVILNGENRGVAGGRNVGIRHHLADPGVRFILLLDDDTRHDPRMIHELVAAYDPSAGRAILGPAIYEMQRPEVVSSLGGKWNRFLGRSRHVVEDPKPAAARGEFLPIDFAIGCCFFTGREVYEAVGLFDEAFCPYYAEDLDFGLLAAEAGYRSACAPRAILWHRVSHGGGGVRFNPRYAFNKGEKTILLMRKHAKPAEIAVFALTQLFFVLGASLREGLRGNIGAVTGLLRGMRSGLTAATNTGTGGGRAA